MTFIDDFRICDNPGRRNKITNAAVAAVIFLGLGALFPLFALLFP